MNAKTVKSERKDSGTGTVASGDKAILPKTSCVAGEPLAKLE